MTMKIATVRLTFDRYKVATKEHKGNLQIEVLYERKRKWLSTGIKLYADQWDDRRHVINSGNAIVLNERINEMVMSMEKWIWDNKPFSWEKFDKYLEGGKTTDNFIDYVGSAIDARNDIKDSTKKSQRKLISMLKEYGKITFFSDLTAANILDFDNWLHGRRVRKLLRDGTEVFEPMKQQSIHDYHKYMKIYIGYARKRGVMKDDPYEMLHFKRGESEEGRYLSEDELHKIEASEMRNGSVTRAKDLFLFQVYTGLSYADLKEFDFSKVKDMEGAPVYSGKRKKTGESFFFVLLPKAMEILKKYDYVLPVISIIGYNQQLKKVAADAGVDKPISSHWARRTAATVFINHGVRVEVIAKILGHADIATTLKFYARLNEKSVIDEMEKADL